MTTTHKGNDYKLNAVEYYLLGYSGKIPITMQIKTESVKK
jgi:hypothetical protein